MDIVYSSSDSYCEIAGISILSLLEHNRNVKELNLYLIDNQISAENKQKLEGMIASFGRTLTYLAHPDIEKRSATEINVGRWNISTFYRLFLPSMLPETVKKVLFIDCDTLVMQDLTPLWEMDMGDKWLYGVDDCRGAAYRTNLGLQPTDNTSTTAFCWWIWTRGAKTTSRICSCATSGRIRAISPLWIRACRTVC